MKATAKQLFQEISNKKELRGNLINDIRNLVRGGEFEIKNKYDDLIERKNNIEKEIKDIQLQYELLILNNTNRRVFEVYNILKKYDGLFITSQGKLTAKFKKFVSENNLNDINLYCKSEFNSIMFEVYFNDSEFERSRSLYIDKGVAEYKEIKLEEVQQAREKHNDLISKIEEIEKQISENYKTASGGYHLPNCNRKNKFY